MDQTLCSIPLKQARMQRWLDRFKEHPEVGDVRSCGLMGAIELVQDKQTKTAHPWQQQRSGKVCKRILEKGVWLRPLGNVIPIIPPLSISEQEIDILMASIEYGLG
jgi:adenosylmethionine-8-amino-7-oxononanoate aminotransferase